MAAQKHSSNRNYIALVEDRGDALRAAEPPAASVHPIRDYLLGLVAAMRSAGREAS